MKCTFLLSTSENINLLMLLVNFLILIVYAFMAKYMYRTFIGGQKQTETSLAINQFNIYHTELQGLIEEGKNIKFHSDMDEGILKTLNYQFIKSNGIEYISAFTIATDTLQDTLKNDKNSQAIINDFRHNVLFPLSRYYDKLFHFLNRVKIDKVLNQDYKNILYNYIERDILQTYFRVCNNCVEGYYMTVDLTPFKTIKYDPETFYRINKFYIENEIFQYKDLAFYKRIF